MRFKERERGGREDKKKEGGRELFREEHRRGSGSVKQKALRLGFSGSRLKGRK